jgi:hypothetical protein
MATQCGLELFSGFIDAVASQVKAIGGVTRREWAATESSTRIVPRQSNSTSTPNPARNIEVEVEAADKGDDEEESEAEVPSTLIPVRTS